VFVATTGQGARDLIFEYDPADDRPPPAFAVKDGGLVVATPFVSAIVRQQPAWRGAPIRFRIGKVEFPQPGDVVDQ